MREIVISENDKGRRLDKYLGTMLPKAGYGFLQKMLRKKNIVVNGKKAGGSMVLKAGDVVSIYFSEDTFSNFEDQENLKVIYEALDDVDATGIIVVYEDNDILVMDKPFGLLSQKAKDGDISVNEVARKYLKDSGYLSFERFSEYRPSIANRLDRNTGGLIIVTKNRLSAVKTIEDIKNKKIRRIYSGICWGKAVLNGEYSAYYTKDSKLNKATLFKEDGPERDLVKTIFSTKYAKDKVSLIEAELLTGKSHQIRVMSAWLGFPLINDEKYGDTDKDKSYSGFSLPGQYLYARKIVLTDNKVIESKIPREFSDIIS